MGEPVTPIWIRIWTVWAVVLALLLLFFIVVEGMAIVRKGSGDTLSSTVWYLRDTGHWLFHLILDVVMVAAIVFAWLLFHFRWQGGRFSKGG